MPPESEEANDNDIQKSARASQKAGEIRKVNLDKFKADNEYIESYFAKHTFEVDFLLAGNAEAIIKILPEIYTQPSAIAKSENLLRSDNVSVSGQEVLRLANKVGKGWFSILLAERLNTNSIIPKYILSSIAFASKASMSKGVFEKMALHRIINKAETLENVEILKRKFSKEGFSFKERYAAYAASGNEDCLNALVSEQAG